MGKFFKKLIYTLAVIFLLGTLLVKTYTPTPVAHATGQDDCNETFTYTVDEDDEDGAELTFSESNNRVNVNFNDTDGNPASSDDFNQVIIAAGSGYEITSVKYDSETSNTNWNTVSVSNPTTTIDLAGTSDSTRIDKVEVKVKKVCAPWTVAIAELVSCGSGQKTFTGTASYGGDTSTTLLVKFNGNTVIDDEGESTSWSFNQNVTSGNTYTITASVYDSSSPDVTGSHQDTPKATDTWTFTVGACAPTDVCPNVDGVQVTVPDALYLDQGICIEKTHVCTDDQANNYDNDVSATEISDNGTCTYDTVTYCIDEVEVSVPVNQDAPEGAAQGACPVDEPDLPFCEEGQNPTDDNGLHICIECEGGGTCEVVIGGDDNEPTQTPTPTVSPTPTPTNAPTHTNIGGPGDGLSDGRSDGRSDGKSDGLGGATNTSGAQVLGASTMAETGNFGSILSNALLALGLTFSTLAGAIHAKKKN